MQKLYPEYYSLRFSLSCFVAFYKYFFGRGLTYYCIFGLKWHTCIIIPYTAEFINRNQRIELTNKQVAFVIFYSNMVDYCSVTNHLRCVGDR